METLVNEILEVNKFSKGFNYSLNYEVILKGIVTDVIVVKFISVNIHGMTYSIKKNNDVIKSEYFRYDTGDNVREKIFEYLKYLNLDEKGILFLTDIIEVCINKCVGRCGRSVVDYDENICDAMLIIKGEDDEKEKIIIDIRDISEKDISGLYGISDFFKIEKKDSNHIEIKVNMDVVDYNKLLGSVKDTFKNFNILLHQNSNNISIFKNKIDKDIDN